MPEPGSKEVEISIQDKNAAPKKDINELSQFHKAFEESLKKKHQLFHRLIKTHLNVLEEKLFL